MESMTQIEQLKKYCEEQVEIYERLLKKSPYNSMYEGKQLAYSDILSKLSEEPNEECNDYDPVILFSNENGKCQTCNKYHQH